MTNAFEEKRFSTKNGTRCNRMRERLKRCVDILLHFPFVFRGLSVFLLVTHSDSPPYKLPL
uniref:AlNc14C110G6369 protein n=1 Tax=Albugo laibachii Nc14 TaxID=890382 RepID=F0WIG9_9STRA|nr:AlNc14C110G6369 [Albugo laibachii Nc14]|eukprot:CCA21051.1 AlNc14C110G6369 [Albugo laibachii Nc14]